MTRMFFHLCLVFLFVSLTSCSMFDSSEDESVAASEMEGEADPIEVETAEGGESDFEDLDLESASADETTSEESTDQASADDLSDDSFGDIEDFNEGQLENELSSESMTAGTVELGNEPQTDASVDNGAIEDLDLEMADTEASPSEETSAAASSVSSSSGNTITNLEYKSQQSGGSVVISAAQPFEYEVRDEPEFNQTVIEIADIDLPDRFKLPYIAKDFEQAVATVNAYQESGSTTARFVIQYKDKLKPAVQLQGSQLMVMNSGAGPIIGQRSRMTGKKISLEMQDINIKDLIYFIADDVGVNIIVDDNVNKTTSVKLKDTPWEEALSLILKTNGLAYERRGEILRIAESKTITDEYNQEAARINAQEGAQRAAQARAVKVIPINYANLDDLAKQVGPFLTQTTNGTGAAGTVIVDKRSSSIIINDYNGPMERAEKLIKSLDVSPVQILIEGKIIEASEEFAREFGVQWGQNGGSVEVGDQTLTLGNNIKADRNPSTFAGGLTTSLSYGTLDGIGDITSILSIYEREQKVKVLSSPKIVTLNKEKAMIESTQQVPNIIVTAVQGVGATQQVQFQDAKLSLAVTPQVSFNSDLIMDIEVNRDIPGPTVGGTSRGINKRKATTKVIVKDGQSLVLGGIFDQTETHAEGGIPLLKDIPILGYLFKTKLKEITKTELVIFLTPRILNPESMLKTTEITSSGDVVKSQSESMLVSPQSSESAPSDESMDEIENEVESL